jgi:DNA polymerase-1
MYGKTAFGLAEELGIPRKEAKEIIDRYFTRYHRVKEFLDRLILSARERGYTETLTGRKRALPELHSKNPMMRQSAERMAMNTPIQGTAADLIKLAMIELDEKLRAGKYGARMTIQVHDELVLEVPESESERVEALVVATMEGAMKLDVPLKVNTAFGHSWYEC